MGFNPAHIGEFAGVVKPKGGNWYDKGPYSFERDVDLLKAETHLGNQTDPRAFEIIRSAMGNIGYSPERITEFENSLHLNNWIDKKLKPYVRNQMATPDDPIRKLADEGVHHMPLSEQPASERVVLQSREREGFPEEGLATTPLGQQWEANADNAIGIQTAGRIQENYLDPGHVISAQKIADHPWISKLDPDTKIYNTLGNQFSNKLGFGHILDVLREGLTTGDIHPEKDLPKISISDAVKRTHEYDKAMKEAQAKAEREELKHANIAHKTDEGVVVKLEKPGQFARESDNMGHSVRGYEPSKGHSDWTKASGNAGSPYYGQGGWDSIKSGRAEVYSVRDADNKPHATIEAGKPAMVGEMAVDYRQLNPENFKKKYSAEEYEDLPKNVTQIKGPGNGDVEHAQRNTVKSFLNSREWGTVNPHDLEKVGLTDLHNPLSIDQSLYDVLGDYKLDFEREQAFREATFRNPDAPRFMNRQEFRDFVDPPAEPIKKAEGGGVKKNKIANTMAEMKAQLLKDADQPFDPVGAAKANAQSLMNLPSKVYEGAKHLINDPKGYISDMKAPSAEEMAMAFNPAHMGQIAGAVFPRMNKTTMQFIKDNYARNPEAVATVMQALEKSAKTGHEYAVAHNPYQTITHTSHSPETVQLTPQIVDIMREKMPTPEDSFLLHTHPSGGVGPSQADVSLAAKYPARQMISSPSGDALAVIDPAQSLRGSRFSGTGYDQYTNDAARHIQSNKVKDFLISKNYIDPSDYNDIEGLAHLMAPHEYLRNLGVQDKIDYRYNDLGMYHPENAFQDPNIKPVPLANILEDYWREFHPGSVKEPAPTTETPPVQKAKGGRVKKKPAYNVDEMRYALTRNK